MSLRRLVREPLIHFVALGALIFAADRWRNGPASDHRTVRVDASLVRGARAELQRRNGRAPTEGELREMLQGYVDDEVLYREALALGLERGDPIVRRRLVQKMDLALRAEGDAREPEDGELHAMLRDEPARWSSAPTMSVTQVFYDPARRGDHADEDARRDLTLAAHRAPAGDPFVLGSTLTAQRAQSLGVSLGQGFVDGLRDAPVGVWVGPLRSRYGVHLARVDARTPGRLPPLDEVRGALRAQWLERRAEQQRRASLDALRGRYRIDVRAVAPATEVASR